MSLRNSDVVLQTETGGELGQIVSSLYLESVTKDRFKARKHVGYVSHRVQVGLPDAINDMQTLILRYRLPRVR
jgi:hypothetical protein